MTREVVVVSAVRTAIGTFGGSLKDVPPTELGALVVRESLVRANVEGKDVGHVVFGHVVNTEPKDMYLSRVAAINGGCAEDTPALNVNRLCGSGLQAVMDAAMRVQTGVADVVIAGGAESMSQAEHYVLGARWGVRGDSTPFWDRIARGRITSGGSSRRPVRRRSGGDGQADRPAWVRPPSRDFAGANRRTGQPTHSRRRITGWRSHSGA